MTSDLTRSVNPFWPEWDRVYIVGSMWEQYVTHFDGWDYLIYFPRTHDLTMVVTLQRRPPLTVKTPSTVRRFSTESGTLVATQAKARDIMRRLDAYLTEMVL